MYYISDREKVFRMEERFLCHLKEKEYSIKLRKNIMNKAAYAPEIKFVFVPVRETICATKEAHVRNAYICANDISSLCEMSMAMETFVHNKKETVLFKTKISMKNGDIFYSDMDLHKIIEMICGE
jgi:uncharacterized protein (UPF0212 family)